VGDPVTLIAPSGQVTPAGVVPRLKQMTVVGTFNSGHYEYDSALVMMHQDDAAKIFRLEGPSGVRLKLRDLHQARQVADQLAASLSGDLLIRDWTRQNRTWFAAVQLEKRMMFIILTLIVAVAAFNLVSTLVMTVTDKRADIAILRTLGASPQSIMGIFVVQGAMVGARERAARQFPAQGDLPHQPHAERPPAQRHHADCHHLAGAGLPGHDLPQLARQPREPGGGAQI
jgi:lipoprotein-releasing system permease protein